MSRHSGLQHKSGTHFLRGRREYERDEWWYEAWQYLNSQIWDRPHSDWELTEVTEGNCSIASPSHVGRHTRILASQICCHGNNLQGAITQQLHTLVSSSYQLWDRWRVEKIAMELRQRTCPLATQTSSVTSAPSTEQDKKTFFPSYAATSAVTADTLGTTAEERWSPALKTETENTYHIPSPLVPACSPGELSRLMIDRSETTCRQGQRSGSMLYCSYSVKGCYQDDCRIKTCK